MSMNVGARVIVNVVHDSVLTWLYCIFSWREVISDSRIFTAANTVAESFSGSTKCQR